MVFGDDAHGVRHAVVAEYLLVGGEQDGAGVEDDGEVDGRGAVLR